jgi:RecA/RadA recombinase
MLKKFYRQSFEFKLKNLQNFLPSFFLIFFKPFSLENIGRVIIDENVKLIILDSIGSLVEREYNYKGVENILKKQDFLSKEIQKFKQISDEFNFPVIVTNFMVKNNYVALGNTFHHAVNIRILLEKGINENFLKIEKSSMSGKLSFPFYIDNGGFMFSRDDEMLDDSEEELLKEMEENFARHGN